ncbi:MAG TPA: ComEA family DNA-binding protein [Candidatus Baltobacteraceae bacterium]|nr:ComEA family DNA-binding protein [Candidatus Baltobacteraceae bacterium]
MKRLLVLGCAAAAVLLALRRPAPPPAIAAAAVAPAAGTAHSQHSRKGHPFAASGGASVVYVVGAVSHPGLYRVPPGARVNDAVERAGGLRADADPAAVNLAERVSDGEEIHVLRMGEAAPAPTRRRKRKTPSPPPAQPLDLNAAGAQSLAAIPGIGPTLAARIVAYRRLNGPFGSLDELADVAGMTQRRIDAMAAYVGVNNP